MLSRILLLIFFLLPVSLMAQTYSLQGKVIDSITGEKLPFVTVLVNETNISGTSTDIDGNFTVKSTKPITALRVSYVGYYQKKIVISSTEKTLSPITILLSPQQQELQDVTV